MNSAESITEIHITEERVVSKREQASIESRSVMRRKNTLKGRPMNEGIVLRADYSCPHCGQLASFGRIQDTDRFFCTHCWAEVSVDGELLKVPGPGPHTQEDVAWEIYERGVPRPPVDEPDYRP